MATTGAVPERVVGRGSTDWAAGATIHTFNLRDEPTSRDLARLAGLSSLISSVELEARLQEVNRAIDALLRREIAGKGMLHAI